MSFAFKEERDLARVLANEPWSFDKYLVFFQQLEEVPISDLEFTHTSFWAQIHNLPSSPYE